MARIFFVSVRFCVAAAHVYVFIRLFVCFVMAFHLLDISEISLSLSLSPYRADILVHDVLFCVSSVKWLMSHTVHCRYSCISVRFQVYAAKWMRTGLFWVITHRVMVISYRRVGTIYRSHLQVSSSWAMRKRTDWLSRNVGKILPLDLGSPETSVRYYCLNPKTGPIGSPETSVRYYHLNPEGGAYR